MSIARSAESTPIDVVISWVDGSDSSFTQKLKPYLNGRPRSTIPGASLTRFASVNEIRYCVLSILTFAPFVRRIFIITDNQKPPIFEDIEKLFPERLGSISIVDHREVFSDYEEYLPTFSSRSIESMMWRIEGLANHFVYFNDDNFLVRPVQPKDWFTDGKPVLRGKWGIAPIPRLCWYWATWFVQRYVLRKVNFEPRPSFHIGQWHAAQLAGYKLRYFVSSHTPHAVERETVANYFTQNPSTLKKNISHKFRNHSQFNFVSLSNHLQINRGNRQFAKPSLVYMQPVKRSKGYIDKKIAQCQRNEQIKFLCAQSLEQCCPSDREKLFGWLESILKLSSTGKILCAAKQ